MTKAQTFVKLLELLEENTAEDVIQMLSDFLDSTQFEEFYYHVKNEGD